TGDKILSPSSHLSLPLPLSSFLSFPPPLFFFSLSFFFPLFSLLFSSISFSPPSLPQNFPHVLKFHQLLAPCFAL
ncbi:hypothetical protein, partial [Streptococcus pyogenes]|uniref:hypothetical protein n=1 Tax=Streptococcus pyogenes TaxID=1314 RepID=UPI001CA37C6B